MPKNKNKKEHNIWQQKCKVAAKQTKKEIAIGISWSTIRNGKSTRETIRDKRVTSLLKEDRHQGRRITYGTFQGFMTTQVHLLSVCFCVQLPLKNCSFFNHRPTISTHPSFQWGGRSVTFPCPWRTGHFIEAIREELAGINNH